MDSPRWNRFVDKLQYKNLCESEGIRVPKTLRMLAGPRSIPGAFKDLPDAFVVKCNKACGRNFVVGDKAKVKPSRIVDAVMGRGSHAAHGWKKGRWNAPYRARRRNPQYEYTKPKLYVEEYLGENVPDVKVVVCRGTATILWIDVCRRTGHRRLVCSVEEDGSVDLRPGWRWGCEGGSIQEFRELERSGKLTEAVRIAERLSRHVDLPLARFDFFLTRDGELLAGECTLTSTGFAKRNITPAAAEWAVGRGGFSSAKTGP